MAATPQVVILAAGKGTRLKSATPKVLQPAAGEPLLEHVLRALAPLHPEPPIVVVGHGAAEVELAFAGRELRFVRQEPQLGTGHALQVALAAWPPSGDVLVVSGDVPLVRAESLAGLVEHHRVSGARATLLSTRLRDPGAYGRLVRAADGRLTAVVEARDASSAELELDEINAGLYVFEAEALMPALAQLKPTNAQGEYYLTDVVRAIGDAGGRLEAVCVEGAQECLGVNTMAELAEAERGLWARRATRLQNDGVRLELPETLQIGPEVVVEAGARIRAHTILEGRSVVRAGAEVGPFVRLQNASVGAGARVLDHCVLLDCGVGEGAAIGPFAHLRPGTRVESGAKVGNFVELKNTTLGSGAKAPHLSYLGDASIGAGANIGAGTITCNYDGTHKHRTEIGDGAFVGSNSTLVAPIEIGAGAYVAAGSALTSSVPRDALALGRSRQTVKPDWARKRRQGGKGKA